MQGDELYRRTVEKWGVPAQISMAIEECAELIVALCKRPRNINGASLEEVTGEMADVEIILEQLKVVFENDAAVDAARRAKLKRLQEYLDSD